MEYTDIEKKSLEILGRTDFKALKKDEVVSITSMLANLRPEVAMEAIKQYPELGKLVSSSFEHYRNILSKIAECDDSSIERFYELTGEAMNDATTGREQFFEMVKRVQSDYSKSLDKDISEQERREIYAAELELIKMADEKEREVRAQQEKAVENAYQKDSEKRQFNWALVKSASLVLSICVGVGLAALGGKMDFNLPILPVKK